jgi:23S rRNA (guanosine2251-2'-O)-methyltransferase
MRIAVILENIRSVHNVGSIFRTADALGAEKVYCCGITPGPLDRFKNVRTDFAKVALGAERSVRWEAGLKIKETIGALKKDGWCIFAIEQAKNSILYYKAFDAEKSNAKIAFILGTETDGILPATLALADKVVEIPMHGKKESLNVAVAFGIVAFRLRDGVVQS